jgi:hypothetical protein
MDRAANGTVLRRQWDITGSEGELDALQHAGAASP